MLEVLREFVALANYGSFRKAADVLFISQPTLSNHIKSLESDLGFQLVDRGKETKLTEAGVLFLTSAESMIKTYDQAVVRCREVASLLDSATMPVRVMATLRTEGRDIVESVLTRENISFVCEDRDLQRPPLAPLHQDDIDLICLYDIPAIREQVELSDFMCRPFGREPCVIILSANHPLADSELTREAVLKEPLQMYSVLQLDYWTSVLCAMLSCSESDLNIALDVSKGGTGRGSWNPKEGLLITAKSDVVNIMRDNPGFVMKDRVDGCELSYDRLIVHKRNISGVVSQAVNALVASVEPS